MISLVTDLTVYAYISFVLSLTIPQSPRRNAACDPNCWRTGLSRLKPLAINLSRRGLYASLIGSDLRSVKAP